MHKKDTSKLHNADAALVNYFDDLLQESEKQSTAGAQVKISSSLLLLSDLESELSDIGSLEQQQDSDPVNVEIEHTK